MESAKRGRDAFTVRHPSDGESYGGFGVLDRDGNLQVTRHANGGAGAGAAGGAVTFKKGEKM